jgi:phenylalanyl-tRNA synthetase beta chain
VQAICGGQAGPAIDQSPRLPQREAVSLRVARAAKVIGMPVTQAQCAGVMRRLGLAFTESEGGLQVSPPSWRFDLQIEEDLIEEVIRVLGYHQLPTDAPLAPVVARVRPEASRSAFAVRHQLADRDYLETINFSFVEARWEADLAGNTNPVRLLNPIAAPLSVMRSSLIGGLVGVLRHNLARKVPRVRVFEVGRVFHRDPTAVDGPSTVAGLRQPMQVGGLAYGPLTPTQWAGKERPVDFYDVKGDVEALFAPRAPRFVAAAHPALHPGRSAAIHVDGVPVGFIGELHPRWRQAFELPQAPILFELTLEALTARDVPVFAGLARHQPVWRDLAVLMPTVVTHDQLIQAVRTAHPLVRSAVLFDVYKPVQDAADTTAVQERSLAVRLELNDDAAALTEERIDAAVAQAVAALGGLGGRLRG